MSFQGGEVPLLVGSGAIAPQCDRSPGLQGQVPGPAPGVTFTASAPWAFFICQRKTRHFTGCRVLGSLSAAENDDSFLWAFVSFQRCSRLGQNNTVKPRPGVGRGS